VLRAALTTALLGATLALAACNGGDAPGATPTATATNAPATPSPTATVWPATPTGSPTAEPPAPSGTATGIAEVDRVIEAVRAPSARGLATMMAYREIECTEAFGAGGPPKCFNAPGRPAEGTPVEVFPFLGCELEWQFDVEEFANRWMSTAGELFAVLRLERPVIDEPEIPTGAYAIVFTSDPASDPGGSAGQALVLDAEGDVVMAVSGCGWELAQFLGDGIPFHGPEAVLRGPAFEE
jgi:hypothetical protein